MGMVQGCNSSIREAEGGGCWVGGHPWLYRESGESVPIQKEGNKGKERRKERKVIGKRGRKVGEKGKEGSKWGEGVKERRKIRSHITLFVFSEKKKNTFIPWVKSHQGKTRLLVLFLLLWKMLWQKATREGKGFIYLVISSYSPSLGDGKWLVT